MIYKCEYCKKPLSKREAIRLERALRKDTREYFCTYAHLYLKMKQWNETHLMEKIDNSL